MVTKTKPKKRVSKKKVQPEIGLVQESLKPALTEVERYVEYFKQDMGFKDTRVTVVLQTQGKRSVLGHFTTQKVYKTKDGLGSHEISISTEHLSLGAMPTAVTVRHELIHALNYENGVSDTSNNGVYHNAKFLKSAEEFGLVQEEKTKKNGHGITKGFNPIYEAIVLQELKPDDSAFDVAREITEARSKTKAKVKNHKWVCACGIAIRAAVTVNGICQNCDSYWELACC
tara:strand:- start:21 stop:707 length:687 start_codon:yes stop_codon:yes gene_type:complete